jgi:small-conductance mechanosensitive channel
MKMESESVFLRKEQERYRAGRELLPLQIELAQIEIQQTNKKLEFLRSYFQQRQQAQLEEARQETLRKAQTTGPLMRALVEHDLLDMGQIQQSYTNINRLTDRRKELANLRGLFQSQFESNAERFEAIGGSNALGVVLRQRRKELLALRNEIQVGRNRDDESRIQAEELSFLLLNELDILENESVYQQQFRQSARSALALPSLTDAEGVSRHLAHEDNRLVANLAGMPTEGAVHREAIDKLRELLVRDIVEMVPRTSQLIKQLQADMLFSVLRDYSRSDVKNLATRLYLLQDHRQMFSEEERKFLSNEVWNRMLEVGEAEYATQLGELIKRRIQRVREQRSVIEDELVKLADLELERQQANKLIQQYLAWIDERVIWIRSASIPSVNDISKSRKSLAWLFASDNWKQLFTDLANITHNKWFGFVPIAAIILLALYVSRNRLKGVLVRHGERASKKHCSLIRPTIYSILITILLSAFWPMLVLLIGWLLESSSTSLSFTHVIGHSLFLVGLYIASLELLRMTVTEGGLAECHFGWPDKSRRHLKWTIRTFYAVSIPLVFVQAVFQTQSNEDYRNTFGRLISCLLFLVLMGYLHRLFRPRGVVFQQMALNNQLMGLYRLRHLIHLAAVLIPFSLLVLSISGYYYTAYQLGACLEQSLSIVVVVILLGGFLFRWLLVRRRATALEESRKMRQAAQEASQEQNEIAAEAKTAAVEQTIEELIEVSRQSRQVVVLLLWLIALSGLFYIWRDILPAIGILDQFELWKTSVGSEVQQVTLLSMFKAGLTVLITWLLIKNMPGLLNMVVQEFSLLDAGARYAATTLFRYFITLVGMVVAFNFLRVQWSQFGWLVAAISVGIGFGLQEIVANFVSGLILLFERPVRIGDTITVDNQVGVVTRIQMRATTIRTWDFQELIIPNKDLMTGKLLNWTLTNSTNRITFSVGVAYGSDPDKVRSVLRQAVSSHPSVLSEPAPLIGMDGFGENALDFTIRCYLESMDNRTTIRHELFTAIAAAFERENISIPYPQIDLHIVSGLEKSLTEQLPSKNDSN